MSLKFKSGRGNNDKWKLGEMIKDIQILKAELLPDAKNIVSDAELKNMDSFQKKKHELNIQLEQIHHNVDRLIQLRKNIGGDGRDATTIKLQSDNTHALNQAITILNLLKLILQRDERRKKLNEKELLDRRHLIVLFQQDIDTMNDQNSRLNHQHTTPEQQVIQKRHEKQKSRQDRHRLKVQDDDIRIAISSSVPTTATEHEVIFETKYKRMLQNKMNY
jgi:hypothetical protein